MKVKSPESKPIKSDTTRKVSPRNRIKYTAQQLHRLEKVFLSTQYPDSSILEDLSNTLNIDSERLSNWFQNRRSKFKRQAKGSHVSWMRQQLYQPGTSQTQGMKDHSEQDKCHVLSPPVANTARKEDVSDKPISNLHYLPSTTPTSCPREQPEYAYNLMTSSMFPSTHNVYSALNDAVSGSDSIHPALQLSHLANEIPYQQPPPYYPATSAYLSPATLTPPGSSLYQNYGASFNFPSAQMSFPHIGY